MAYQDFLAAFAQAQGVGSVDDLMSKHAERYSFQIKSRERAVGMIKSLADRFGLDFKGKRILDVGCAYGSHSIELAKLGASVVGVDISNKWLGLAEINARDEAEVRFLNCDASSYMAYSRLKDDGPYDIFIINDVFEHIFDTAGLLANLAKLGAASSTIYFKVPNGQATRHVLVEGHKKVFGISLLAPDYWSEFITAPFHIYYRRWAYFQALFNHYGFTDIRLLNEVTDPDIDTTRRFIVNDLNKIRRHLKAENFENARQFGYLRAAARYYYEEVKEDLETMEWEPLFHKYRTTFWEGIVTRKAG